jgi:polar amino acid transport system substrate-binding protein
MKKIVRICAVMMAVAMMVACFAGCGAKGDKYIIATDTTFAPFEFTNDKGEFVGIDVELLAAIAADQDFEYDLQPLGFNAAVTALETSQADAVIAGMSITEKRQEKYNFSDAYYDSGVVMAIAADNEEIKSYADLKDKTVAVKSGTEGQTFAESIKDQYGFKVDVLEGSGLMYEAVKTGNAVACFEDYPVMGYGISQGNGLKMVTDMEKGSSYGFAVLKGAGNDDLVAKFNAGLKNLKENGKYQEILDKYIATK